MFRGLALTMINTEQRRVLAGASPLGCRKILSRMASSQLLVDLVRDGLAGGVALGRVCVKQQTLLCQLRVRHVSPHLLERPSSVADHAITRTRRIS